MEHGAGPNIRYDSGDTPLTAACWESKPFGALVDEELLDTSYDKAKALLEHGADVRAKNEAGRSTVSLLGPEKEYGKLRNLLIKYGADKGEPARLGYRPKPFAPALYR